MQFCHSRTAARRATNRFNDRKDSQNKRLAALRLDVLTFDTATAYTLHNVLAKEDKHEEQRRADNCDGCHLLRIVDVAYCRIDGESVAQTIGYEFVRRVVGDKQGPHVEIGRAHV